MQLTCFEARLWTPTQRAAIINFILELFQRSTHNLGVLIANQRDAEISLMLSQRQLCLINKDALPWVFFSPEITEIFHKQTHKDFRCGRERGKVSMGNQLNGKLKRQKTFAECFTRLVYYTELPRNLQKEVSTPAQHSCCRWWWVFDHVLINLDFTSLWSSLLDVPMSLIGALTR